MRDRLTFAAQFMFTALVAAFLIVPAALSMLAGATLVTAALVIARSG